MKKLLYLLIVMMSGVVSGTAVTSCTSDEADEHGSIYGMVSVSGTAEPMRGIGVELYKDDALLLKTVTYDDGHFEFTDLVPGNYKLVVRANGYRNAEYPVVVEVGRMARVDMQLVRLSTNIIVRTISTTDIRGDRVTLNGEYSIKYSGYKPSDVGFIYSSKLNPQEGGTIVTSILSTPFSSVVEGLQKGIYYYQAYAKNDIGIEYGEILTFEISGEPIVTTLEPTNVKETTATLNARIDYVGNPPYSERGFVYSSTYPNPTVDDPETETTKVVVQGSYNDMSTNISDLTEDTNYFVRSYVKNIEGIFYGETLTFRTLNLPYIIIGNLAIQLKDLRTAGTYFGQAEFICSSSNVGGYNDWRLPTIDELEVLYENRKEIKGFDYFDTYWSSSLTPYTDYPYYGINFSNGNVVAIKKDAVCRVRAVRTVK